MNDRKGLPMSEMTEREIYEYINSCIDDSKSCMEALVKIGRSISDSGIVKVAGMGLSRINAAKATINYISARGEGNDSKPMSEQQADELPEIEQSNTARMMAMVHEVQKDSEHAMWAMRQLLELLQCKETRYAFTLLNRATSAVYNCNKLILDERNFDSVKQTERRKYE